jgi:hypothetical protein
MRLAAKPSLLVALSGDSSTDTAVVTSAVSCCLLFYQRPLSTLEYCVLLCWLQEHEHKL